MVPSILARAGVANCGGDEALCNGMVFDRDPDPIGMGVFCSESRMGVSCRPEERDMPRGSPHEVRRSFLGLDGGLVCKGQKA
jgi:hypothetical protein